MKKEIILSEHKYWIGVTNWEARYASTVFMRVSDHTLHQQEERQHHTSLHPPSSTNPLASFNVLLRAIPREDSRLMNQQPHIFIINIRKILFRDKSPRFNLTQLHKPMWREIPLLMKQTPINCLDPKESRKHPFIHPQNALSQPLYADVNSIKWITCWYLERVVKFVWKATVCVVFLLKKVFHKLTKRPVLILIPKFCWNKTKTNRIESDSVIRANSAELAITIGLFRRGHVWYWCRVLSCVSGHCWYEKWQVQPSKAVCVKCLSGWCDPYQFTQIARRRRKTFVPWFRIDKSWS